MGRSSGGSHGSPLAFSLRGCLIATSNLFFELSFPSGAKNNSTKVQPILLKFFFSHEKCWIWFHLDKLCGFSQSTHVFAKNKTKFKIYGIQITIRTPTQNCIPQQFWWLQHPFSYWHPTTLSIRHAYNFEGRHLRVNHIIHVTLVDLSVPMSRGHKFMC